MKTYAQTQSPALASLFNNLENGNIDDAKRQARRHSAFRLSMFARQILFWSHERATLAANYLKGKASFQQYCDAK